MSSYSVSSVSRVYYKALFSMYHVTHIYADHLRKRFLAVCIRWEWRERKSEIEKRRRNKYGIRSELTEHWYGNGNKLNMSERKQASKTERDIWNKRIVLLPTTTTTAMMTTTTTKTTKKLNSWTIHVLFLHQRCIDYFALSVYVLVKCLSLSLSLSHSLCVCASVCVR